MRYSIDTNFKKLKEYEEIEDYYGEIDDIHLFLQEVFCDRVESQKYIVRANKEIERLHSIIKEVREYLTSIETNYSIGCWNKEEDEFIDVKKDILDILDKVDKEK